MERDPADYCQHETELYLVRWRRDDWHTVRVGCRCELEPYKKKGDKVVGHSFFRMIDRLN